MKKGILLSIASGVLFCLVINAQSVIVIQPDAEEGKDAYLRSLAPNSNFGNHPDLLAHTWTNLGEEVIVRGLLEFDLSVLPPDIIIDSAKLSLYSYTSPANGYHSILSGSNEAVLRRVTGNWDEFSVTWNTQPSYTTENEVILPKSINGIQHYLNIDVTEMVVDMVDDPENSHGFFFCLITEEYYRRMLFASSDNSNSELHPMLEIFYRGFTSTQDKITGEREAFTTYPNPAENFVHVEIFNAINTCSLNLFNSLGELVAQKQIVSQNVNVDVSNYKPGIYFLFLSIDGNPNPLVRKVVIK